jgi:hypothetical protein
LWLFDVGGNNLVNTNLPLFRKPFVYSSGIMSIRTIVVVWLIGVFATSISFYKYDRPPDVWLTRMIPLHLIFLVLYLLAFIFTHLVHLSILRLLGLDCSEPRYEFAIKNLDPRYAFPELIEIFSSDREFHTLQKYVFDKVHNNTREKFALLTGFLLLLFVYISDRTQGKNNLLGDDPYPVYSNTSFDYFLTIIQLLTQSLLAAGALSGLFLILVVVRGLSKMNKISKVIVDMSNYHEIVEQGENNTDIHGKYTLKSFKQKANIIPQTLLPIILIIFLIILLAGSGILYYILLRGGGLILTYLTLIFMIVFFSIDVFLFFYPQFSLHQILKDSKDEMIEIYDRQRDEKKIILIGQKSNLTLEQKQELWVDIKFLNYLISELNEFLTWPFNYKQLLTLLISIVIITLLTVTIFGFLELVSRIIET